MENGSHSCASQAPAARPDRHWHGRSLPWSILVADVESTGRDRPNDVPVITAVTSGHTPVDPILQNPGGIGLRWAADDSLVYLSYRDGFPHLYSIQHPGRPGDGSKPILLTPGSFMVEQVTLTPDRRFAIYNANTGSDPGDIDRRHLFKVPVNAATPTPLSITSGTGIEWSPVVTADNQTVAFLRSDAQLPRLPAIIPVSGGTVPGLGEKFLPAEFPAPNS
jgi:hypothetical protein